MEIFLTIVSPFCTLAGVQDPVNEVPSTGGLYHLPT
jgi:hypothetical protein